MYFLVLQYCQDMRTTKNHFLLSNLKEMQNSITVLETLNLIFLPYAFDFEI